MSANLETLTAERDRIERELNELQDQKDALDKHQAEVTAKLAAAEGDQLAKLKIDAEQTAEGQRSAEHQLSEVKRRFNDIEEEIALLQQSSIV